MKKLFFVFVLLLGTCTALAESVQQGAITYYTNYAKKTAYIGCVMFDKVKEAVYTLPSTFVYEDEEYSIIGIADAAFRNGRNNEVCKKIVIPESITIIGKGALSNCKYVKEIVLPSQISTITISAFSHCESLETIIIPNGVTAIGEGAFSGCYALKQITIPNTVKNIYSKAFGQTSIKELILPEGMTIINNGAFREMPKLQKIVIPSTITEIGDYAFLGDERLSAINLPNITIIKQGSFIGCASLESIVLPENITSIEADAFENCINLAQVTFPSTMKYIGSEAFNGCSSLKTIYCNTVIPPTIGFNPFLCSGFFGCGGQIMEDATLYVPKGCAETYKKSETPLQCSWDAMNVVETDVEPTIPADIIETLKNNHNQISSTLCKRDDAVVQSKYISVYDDFPQEPSNIGRTMEIIQVQKFIKDIINNGNPMVKVLAKELKSVETPDEQLQVFLRNAKLYYGR